MLAGIKGSFGIQEYSNHRPVTFKIDGHEVRYPPTHTGSGAMVFSAHVGIFNFVSVSAIPFIVYLLQSPAVRLTQEWLKSALSRQPGNRVTNKVLKFYSLLGVQEISKGCLGKFHL